jgi:ABC-2 type transport system ATP-binding protein
MPFAIEMTGLNKRFGKVLALNGLNIAIKRGEIYGLLGANGAGKSTTIRLICGLLQADAGAGHCLGSALGVPSGDLGYMPQRGNLYDDLTVDENLRFFAGAHGLHTVDIPALLLIHDLSARAQQRVGTLSGGWRQRVAFVVSILHQPKLLLLDEPSAGLDPQAREQLWTAIRNLASQQGTTVLVSTHYIEEASRCDRIGYLSGGQLLAEGEPHQLADKLKLQTWHIALREGLPNTIDGLSMAHACLNRVSDGWRCVALKESTLPTAVADWCKQNAVTATATQTDLADVLAWLAHMPNHIQRAEHD